MKKIEISAEREEAARKRRDAAEKPRIREIIEGLQLIEATSKDKDGYCVSAGHDIIVAGQPEDMTDEQIDKMLELGWHISSEFGCWGKFT